jgi:hypothetical protein
MHHWRTDPQASGKSPMAEFDIGARMFIGGPFGNLAKQNSTLVCGSNQNAIVRCEPEEGSFPICNFT